MAEIERRASYFWTVLFTVLGLLIIISLLAALKVFAISTLISSIIYTATVVLLVMAVLHWIGVF